MGNLNSKSMKISNFAKDPPPDGDLNVDIIRFIFRHFLRKQEKLNTKITSYGIKHVVENFCAVLYRREECHTRNSLIIEAMKRERYTGERSRENSANYLFNISTQSLLDLKVVEDRLIKNYDATMNELDSLFSEDNIRKLA